MINTSFRKDKRVFVTGYTGFKGACRCFRLKHLEVQIVGYFPEPATEPFLCEVANVGGGMLSIMGDK